MANTLTVRFRAFFQDELNIIAECVAYALVDPDASFSAIQTVLNTWLATVDTVSGAQIIASEIEVLQGLPAGLKIAPVAGSRAEQTGLFDFTNADDQHVWAFAVPAIADSLVVSGKIDLTAGQPAQLLAAYLVSGGTAALTWTNPWSQVLTSFASALLSFRQYRHQMARLSFET